MQHRPERTAHPRAERGSISIFYVLAAVGMAVIVGLGVDLGGMVHAKQRAFDVAAQAARAGGEAIRADQVMAGQPLVLDQAKGKAAAEAYLAAAGLNGSAYVTATTVEVTAHYEWAPVVLGQFGFGAHQFTGTASARLVRALDGSER